MHLTCTTPLGFLTVTPESDVLTCPVTGGAGPETLLLEQTGSWELSPPGQQAHVPFPAGWQVWRRACNQNTKGLPSDSPKQGPPPRWGNEKTR